ncbi:hypothetical protein [Flavobacterium silvaticum]|uniref:Lipoprotein n=1 Tax=Flavobacterium silvaticum TaxID=1852020 RepID=A0A972G2S7_9FLAO|nr:hypothetical protein [Flavobacterium silvaticum]NMH29436.1 hypothetical protein [Flavobacterium silvaticum]
MRKIILLTALCMGLYSCKKDPQTDTKKAKTALEIMQTDCSIPTQETSLGKYQSRGQVIGDSIKLTMRIPAKNDKGELLVFDTLRWISPNPHLLIVYIKAKAKQLNGNMVDDDECIKDSTLTSITFTKKFKEIENFGSDLDVQNDINVIVHHSDKVDIEDVLMHAKKPCKCEVKCESEVYYAYKKKDSVLVLKPRKFCTGVVTHTTQ